MRLLLAITASLAVLGCAKAQSPTAKEPAPASAQREANLIFTSDLWGQLEPCGCSADMRGGLDRAASFVAQERAAGPTLLVDAGDALFDALQYAPDQEVQARLKAKAVAASLVAMGVSAKASFERDRLDPSLLAAAFPKGVLLQGPALREVGGIQVGLVPFDAIPIPDDAQALASLQREIQTSRGAGAEVVAVLLHAPRERAIRLGPPSGADLVVASHIDNIAEGEKARAVLQGSPLFFTQARGQSLLQIQVVMRPGGGPLQIAGNEESRDAEIESIGERIRSYEQRIAQLGDKGDPTPFRQKVEELQQRRRALSEEAIPLPATGSYLAWRFVPVTQDRPSDPAVKEILSRYDREVAKENLAFAKASNKVCEVAPPDTAGYVGQAVCASCHSAAQGFWETTAHAHAYATLEKIDKQYDLNCISCHVTGWDRPSGPCRVDEVEGRKNVSCEACHGPGSLHVGAPDKVRLVRDVPAATCQGCHTPEQSTDFDYPAYLKRILGPGHGAPAAAPEKR